MRANGQYLILTHRRIFYYPGERTSGGNGNIAARLCTDGPVAVLAHRQRGRLYSRRR